MPQIEVEKPSAQDKSDLKVGDFLYGGFRGGAGNEHRIIRVHAKTVRVDGLRSLVIDKATLRCHGDDSQYRFFHTQDEESVQGVAGDRSAVQENAAGHDPRAIRAGETPAGAVSDAVDGTRKHRMTTIPFRSLDRISSTRFRHDNHVSWMGLGTPVYLDTASRRIIVSHPWKLVGW